MAITLNVGALKTRESTADPWQSSVVKTDAVMDANNITYDSTETYDSGTVGEELNSQKNTLNSKADEESLALRRSGATNTGAQIEKGTFFYLDGTLKHAIATIAQNASFTAQNCETVTAGGLNELYSYISKRIIPTGTISMSGIICKSGSVYEIIIYLPSIIITSNSVTITCSEFRPGGQTVVKDTNPTVSKNAGTNTIIVYTTDSSFASYVGSEGVAKLTFNWN